LAVSILSIPVALRRTPVITVGKAEDVYLLCIGICVCSFESIVWGLTLAEGEPRKHDSTLVLA
jgi:hypothetical protein